MLRPRANGSARPSTSRQASSASVATASGSLVASGAKSWDQSRSFPPYTRDWGEIGPRQVLVEGTRAAMIEILPTVAGPGALVLFRMMPRAIAKHVGIMTSESRFIHAYERLGVIEEALTPAWRRRTAFAFLSPRMKGDVR